MSTKYAVIDIETTGGLPRRDRIIEIGIILYDGEKELDRFESLIDPGISIPLRSPDSPVFTQVW